MSDWRDKAWARPGVRERVAARVAEWDAAEDDPEPADGQEDRAVRRVVVTLEYPSQTVKWEVKGPADVVVSTPVPVEGLAGPPPIWELPYRITGRPPRPLIVEIHPGEHTWEQITEPVPEPIEWSLEQLNLALGDLLVRLHDLRTHSMAADLVWIFPLDFCPGLGRLYELPVIYASVDKPTLAHRPA